MKDKYLLFDDVHANTEQRQAIDDLIKFLHSNDREYILVGRGGTGKTTIIKKVIDYYCEEIKRTNKKKLFGSDNIVAATISHAAKNVLQKFIGGGKAMTVAKLLAMRMRIKDNGEVEFTPDSYLASISAPPITKVQLLIIDEASMISKKMYNLINENISTFTKVIYMGDNVQLPPIDTERVPNEDSPTFNIKNKSKLTERVRQGEDSPIIPISDFYARNIEKFNNEGKIEFNPLKKKYRITDFDKVRNKGVIFTDSVKYTIEQAVKDFKEDMSPNAVRCISYRKNNPYKIAPYNVASINNTIRSRLWKDKKQYVIGDIVVANNQFSVGRETLFYNSDYMAVTKIEEGVHNEIDVLFLELDTEYDYLLEKIPVVSNKGRKKYYAKLTSLKKEALSNPSKWREFYAFKDKFADISYGYAVTSHKAQGSTYRNVYIFEDDIFGVSTNTRKEKNQSMYVSVTRASDKLIIFSKRFMK